MPSEKLLRWQQEKIANDEAKRQKQLQQKARIRAAFFAEPETLLLEFGRLQTTDELHYFAANCNWYDSSTTLLLRQVIRNPLCDRGTALMIYWRANIASLYTEYAFSDYASRDEIPEEYVYERQAYDLVKEIEARFAANFYTLQTIQFDPASKFDNPARMSNVLAKMKHPIAKIMRQPTLGRVLERLEF